jgi:hypothetical protein
VQTLLAADDIEEMVTIESGIVALECIRYFACSVQNGLLRLS